MVLLLSFSPQRSHIKARQQIYYTPFNSDQYSQQISKMSQLSLPRLDLAFLHAAKQSAVSLVKTIANFFVSKQADLKGKQAVAGVLLIVLGGQLYYWNKHSFWRRRGVKGPRPLPIFGNFLAFNNNPRQRLEQEWIKKYGKLFGYYMGVKPYLVVADAAVLKKICIRDFDKFPNHFFVAVKNKYQKHFLIMQRDDHWRGMRSVFTPTFTSGKIKMMYKIMDACVDDLIMAHRDRLRELEDGKVTGHMDARAVMGAFAMGSALCNFYGVSLERDKSEDIDPDALTKDNFAKRSTEALTQSYARFVASHLVPQCIMRFFNIPLIGEKRLGFFSDQAERIIERRKKSDRRYNDFLQLLLEARSDEKLEKAASDEKEKHHALEIDAVTQGDIRASKTRPSKIQLTKDEVKVSTMMLMMVATETTSVLLSNTIYLLAHHPDIQEELYREVMRARVNMDEINNSNQVSEFRFDYDALTSCEYLDCVVAESLRLMSPVIALDREASEDYYIEDYDVWIPKGQVVYLSFYSIMRDPDYWPEPLKFDPERFRPENRHKIVPGSYCPFGVGPRSCIGFRFSLTEAKIALSKCICEFQYMPAPGTKYPPDPKRPSYIQNESENMLVNYRPRV